jgi:hypothetical protein
MDQKMRTQACALPKAVALLCVLLVLLAGGRHLNHVHAKSNSHPRAFDLFGSSRGRDRPLRIARFRLSTFDFRHPRRSLSTPLLVASFLYIRPPPSV